MPVSQTPVEKVLALSRGSALSVNHSKKSAERRVFLAGNPNSGKSTLFNSLTGLKQKVANYPGVTVERRTGRVLIDGQVIELTDLPGTYSLSSASEDEDVVRETLLDAQGALGKPDLVVVALDAARLERNLFLLLQLQELGYPLLVALTMNDEASRRGRRVDPRLLSELLCLQVVEVHAAKNEGIPSLRSALLTNADAYSCMRWRPSRYVQEALDQVERSLCQEDPKFLEDAAPGTRLRAWLLLLDAAKGHAEDSPTGQIATRLAQRLDGMSEGWRTEEANWRYHEAAAISKAVTQVTRVVRKRRTQMVDDVLTHPVWGLLFFLSVMAVVFQAVFSWAEPLIAGIEGLTGWAAALVKSSLPAGPLQGLLADGIVTGVGSVVVFLPQIAILFLALAILEDTGYMARAAAVMHKHMRKVGLHGRAFVPLISGFACAVPAILATRSIPGSKDRLTTMLVLPLVSCSARLPVYSLMIGAFVPSTHLGLGLTLQGLILWSAYAISIISAAGSAMLLKSTLLRGKPEPLIMELPPYRMPSAKTVSLAVLERCKVFLSQAGTIILALSVMLWFLLSFPTADAGQGNGNSALQDAEQIQQSFAGRIGKAIEPAIEPLGFDWKIGIGLIGSFAAREVLISTLAVVYGVSGADDESASLSQQMLNERDPATGLPVYSTLTALSLIVFFILACQCISTLAVVKRETGGWYWPMLMMGYMTALAYLGSLAVYQLGLRFAPWLAVARP